jgi:hypothetical protein
MEFRMFYWDTVVTNRALARDQYFVKVMPRDFVGERLSLDPWMNWLAIGCRNEESAL